MSHVASVPADRRGTNDSNGYVLSGLIAAAILFLGTLARARHHIGQVGVAQLATAVEDQDPRSYP